MIEIFVSQIKANKRKIKIAIASLEVLVVLLKEDSTYSGNNKNVLETVLVVTDILDENPQNMDIIMPSIATYLALRDKNFEGLVKALVFLKSPSLNLLKKLAH